MTRPVSFGLYLPTFTFQPRYFILALGVVVLASMIVKHVQFDAERKRSKALKERANLLEAANNAAEIDALEMDSIQMPDNIRYADVSSEDDYSYDDRPLVSPTDYAGE